MVGVAAGFSCIRGNMRACLSTQGVGGIFIVGGIDFCCETFFFFFSELCCCFFMFSVCVRLVRVFFRTCVLLSL